MDHPEKNSSVLVTGATGFIASRVVLDLLERGYLVRGTVRDLERGAVLKDWLSPYTDKLDNLRLVEADLMSGQGWDQAVDGCRYVLHLASPFPLVAPENEDDLIRPAVEGTRRVLAAAVRSGVQRVVQTSSVAAVSYGHGNKNRTFSEKDWSNLDGEIEPYQKSKTLAERAAWEFVETLPEGESLELATICPGYVLGPVINDRQPTSTSLLKMLMEGAVPGVARLKFDLVDVRDVSWVHLAAMTNENAPGKRFLCVGGGVWLSEIARILSDHFRSRGYRIPQIQFPDWFIHIYALFNAEARLVAKDVGKDPNFDISQTQEILGWTPLPLEKTLIEMGESLIEFGVIKKRNRR
jgi:nucleoside-diphosphate-sugar epimerase